MDLLRTGSKAASQARPGAEDHGSMPKGRVLYAPSWTTWPGRWMHASPTLFNCTNLIVDANAQSRAEKPVTQEIAGVCCERRVGVGLRQPLGSRTGLGVRGERRGPPQPLRVPHTFARRAVSKVVAGVGDGRPRGPSPLCPREIGEWLESRPGSRTVVQLQAHHHQPLHLYSKLSLSTVLASDDGEGAPNRRSGSKGPRTGEWSSARHRQGPTKMPGIRPSIYVHRCSKTHPRLSSVDMGRWDPTTRLVSLSKTEKALGQLTRGRGHVDRKKGATTRLGPRPRFFVANLDELSLWSDRSTLHDTMVVDEVR